MKRPSPRLYSYVLREDTGFAPNPYHGFCTLACCKPLIRRRAETGDWVIATGSNAKGKRRGGFLSLAMRVTEILTFQEYWDDVRFRAKRPDLDGILEEACGDNLYQRDPASGQWLHIQAYHCEFTTMQEDTSVDRVLISNDFMYWGGNGPPLPEFGGYNLCKEGRGYRVNFPEEVTEEFVEWIRRLQGAGETGVCGNPLDLKMSEKIRRKSRKPSGSDG